MQVNPHLNFNGECEAAFRFYEQVLGGKIVVMMKYGESPMAATTPAVWHDKIIHATLSFGDYRLTGSDLLPESYRKPQGFSAFLNVDTTAEAERIYNALLEEGVVDVPLQQTFWAQRFGMLVDRFGTPWLINCGKSK